MVEASYKSKFDSCANGMSSKGILFLFIVKVKRAQFHSVASITATSKLFLSGSATGVFLLTGIGIFYLGRNQMRSPLGCLRL